MATTPLFTPALASLGDLVPHDGLLCPDELEEVALAMADRRSCGSRSSAWMRAAAATSSCTRTSGMDAWVLSWMPGQATGYHDHYISGVGIAVAAGGVREDLWSTEARTSRSTSAPATRGRAARATSIGCATTRDSPR